MLVRQEHPQECGIACMAMAMGVTLDEARAAFERVYPGARAKGRGVTEGITCTEMDVVLAEHGYAISRLYCGPADNRRDPWPPEPFADVHIVQVHTTEGGHFAVLLRDGTVLDPAFGVTTLDDARYGAVMNVAAAIRLLTLDGRDPSRAAGPYSIQEIRNSTFGPGHYRITDAGDNRVATCYLRENAERVCAALNATAANGCSPHSRAPATQPSADDVPKFVQHGVAVLNNELRRVEPEQEGHHE